jgi:hypothetical protein
MLSLVKTGRETREPQAGLERETPERAEMRRGKGEQKPAEISGGSGDGEASFASTARCTWMAWALRRPEMGLPD